MLNDEDFEKMVREKINFVLSSQKTNVNLLAKGDLTLQRKLNGQIHEKRRISAYTLYVVLSEIPDLSAEWLFGRNQTPSR